MVAHHEQLLVRSNSSLVDVSAVAQGSRRLFGFGYAACPDAGQPFQSAVASRGNIWAFAKFWSGCAVVPCAWRDDQCAAATPALPALPRTLIVNAITPMLNTNASIQCAVTTCRTRVAVIFVSEV